MDDGWRSAARARGAGDFPSPLVVLVCETVSDCESARAFLRLWCG